MTQAVGDLLIDKGIIGADELRAMLEAIDAKSPAAGARMVARAWSDEAFKARMMADVTQAAAELGIDAGSLPIRAVETNAAVPTVIVFHPLSRSPPPPIGLPPTGSQ